VLPACNPADALSAAEIAAPARVLRQRSPVLRAPTLCLQG
jgi:hypothetical protein